MVEVNAPFSRRKEEALLGVLRDSILSSLLSNIYVNDIFIFLEETGMCNFLDGGTSFVHYLA